MVSQRVSVLRVPSQSEPYQFTRLSLVLIFLTMIGMVAEPVQSYVQPRLAEVQVRVEEKVQEFVNPPTPEQKEEARVEALNLDRIFSGGENALVTIAVGSAEGTRTPQGGKTRYWNNHTDPGNGKNNQGSFSYQHGAANAEEADKKQLTRLRGQTDQMTATARRLGMKLNLEELLGLIDLANQSPAAALGGVVPNLQKAKEQGMTGTDAIVWARSQSFRGPDGRLNAPGLGNTESGVRRDQQRRSDEILKAIVAQGLKPDSPTAILDLGAFTPMIQKLQKFPPSGFVPEPNLPLTWGSEIQ